MIAQYPYRLRMLRTTDQSGINMVDLMMWLVIAALLLASALQSIGYYQKAAITHTLKSDASAVRTYMERHLAVAGTYPTRDKVYDDIRTGEVKLSGGSTITGIYSDTGISNWAVRICSPHLDPLAKGSAVRIQRDSPNEFDMRVCSHIDDPMPIG